MEYDAVNCISVCVCHGPYCGKCSVAVIRYCRSRFIDGGVIGHSAGISLNLADRVAVASRCIKCDARELHASVRCVLRLGYCLAVGVFQNEAEFAFRHIASGQFLRDRHCRLAGIIRVRRVCRIRRCYGIRICEFEQSARNFACRHAERSVTVIRHCHVKCLGCFRIVCHSRNISGLGHCVSKRLLTYCAQCRDSVVSCHCRLNGCCLYVVTGCLSGILLFSLRLHCFVC